VHSRNASSASKRPFATQRAKNPQDDELLQIDPVTQLLVMQVAMQTGELVVAEQGDSEVQGEADEHCASSFDSLFSMKAVLAVFARDGDAVRVRAALLGVGAADDVEADWIFWISSSRVPLFVSPSLLAISCSSTRLFSARLSIAA